MSGDELQDVTNTKITYIRLVACQPYMDEYLSPPIIETTSTAHPAPVRDVLLRSSGTGIQLIAIRRRNLPVGLGSQPCLHIHRGLNLCAHHAGGERVRSARRSNEQQAFSRRPDA